MIFRRYGSFAGGIQLPEEKQATQDLPIRQCPIPQRLRVPLTYCGGRPAGPLVEVNATVRASGRIAAAADAESMDVFAPLSGRVAGLTVVSVAGPDGFVRCPAIELTELSETPDPALRQSPFEWRQASCEQLLDRLGDAGAATHRQPTEPLRRWVHRAKQKGCTILVANAMEPQPYVTADHRMLIDNGTDVITGLAILAKVIGADRVMLAADRRRTDRYRRILAPARRLRINLVALQYKYPTGADKILLKVLTGKEVPPGREPMDVGVAVTDVATCLSVYRAAVCGEPATGRVVTVSGERASNAGNFYVPFGASYRELTGTADPPIIHGGPMNGLRCPEDAVVGPSSDAVLAIDSPAPAAATPCIRCGWCTDHCPARLNVAVLNDVYELGRMDQARRLSAEACIGCGVCSYVCPARLPLSQRVKQLTRSITAERREMPLFAESKGP
ncbi:MAG: RnfABCDGE type electron transport complex subunit C [Phycisphaerae bacterium]|nr:RnfABCDGE type electron transport complex subunit C [Phycisphaerae bacterium]